MKKLKKLNKRIILGILLAIALTGGVVYAVFTDKAELLGTSVSVASADIRLLDDLAGGVEVENLAEAKPGPRFENIGPSWEEYYGVKVFNNGNAELNLSSFADYETVNDPEELRSIVFVELFHWDDVDGDGLIDPSETGQTFGEKSIVKWKTQGFDLGSIQSGEVRAFALRFYTDGLSNHKQGASMVFNFDFTSTEIS